MKSKIFTKIHLKKSLILTSAIFLISSFSVLLTSCASNSLETSLKNSISKESGTKFSDNLDLFQASQIGLTFDNGQKSALSYYASKLAYNWLDEVAKQPNQIQYTNLFNDQIEAIDNEYNELIKSYKNQYNNDWSIFFQREVLDKNGGTEHLYKQLKLFDWAKMTLISKIFEKNYLTIKKGDQFINNPNEASILTALNDSKTNYNPTTKGTISNIVNGFIFSDKGVTSGKNEFTDPKYATFQQYIFDKWIQIQAPFVINMSLWKYGTPLGGINSLYNIEQPPASQNEGTAEPPSGGSYPFPYFNNIPNNSSPDGGLTKFQNFVTEAKTKNNFYQDVTAGLIKIPTTYTDDSATYILAKNSSIYNDLYPEFAAASTYLYGTYTKKITADVNIKKNLTTTSSTAYDQLTSNFVGSSSLLNTKEIKLSQNLISQIINNTGPLKNEIKDTFVIDAFQVKDTYLSDFMLLRNEAGVHAIAIDGNKYIATGKDFDEAKYLAGNIILYRYLMGNKFSETNFNSIDIKTELLNFFNLYSDYLLLDYAFSTSTNPAFLDINALNSDELSLLKKLNDFFIENQTYEFKKNYQNKIFETKNKYAQNFGINTKKNGLAAPWIYSGTKLGGDGYFEYELTKVLENNNPYTTPNGTYNNYINAITTFLTAIKVAPLSSSFEGFKYSQFIYSNNDMLNKIILNLGNEDFFANLVKMQIYETYLGNDIDYLKFNFQDTIAPYLTTPSKNLNNSANNLYHSTVFDSNADKWYGLSTANSSTITSDEITSFIKSVWSNSIENTKETSLSTYVTYLSFASSVKLLLSNNADYFLNYLKSKITYGNDSYLIWLDTQNSYLNKNIYNDPTTALSKININQNNNFRSVYTNQAPDSSIPIDLNNNYNGFYDNGNTKYFNFIENKNGFLGLQTETSNQLPSAIQNVLWNEPKIKNVNGLMYSYNSWDDLIKHIENFSYIKDVETLANSIKQKTKGIQIEDVLNKEKNLQEKKDALIFQIDKLKIDPISANYFTQLNGLISNSFINDTSTNLFLNYSAFAKQINTTDILDVTTLLNKIGDDCFLNLVVSAAMDSEVQSGIISYLSYQNKTNVYDLRLNNQLGSAWVKNWI